MFQPPELPPESRDHDELTTLAAMLDYYRSVLIRKGAGLTQKQMADTLPPSDLSIGGLLKHMALVENQWFREDLLGEPAREPFASVDWASDPDWEFRTAAQDSPQELLTLLTGAIELSRDALRQRPDLEHCVPTPAGKPKTNVRWVLVHMIEEYARHAGHADLIRQSIDGATGD